MWRRMRLEDFSLTLVPKQGFQIIYKDNEFLKVGGRSSGKVTWKVQFESASRCDAFHIP